MPQVFKVYGQTIIISDDFDFLNGLRSKFRNEAKRAAEAFMIKYDSYGSIETLLEKGFYDGLSIISDVIQRKIISEIFMKLKIYDLDGNRFCREFYQCPWGEGLEILLNRHSELVREFNALISAGKRAKSQIDFAHNIYQKTLDNHLSDMNIKEALSSAVFGKWGMSESHRKSVNYWEKEFADATKLQKERLANAIDKSGEIDKEIEELYTSDTVREALKNEMFNAVMMLWSSCYAALNRYGVVNPSTIPALVSDAAERANAMINNIPHMAENDLLALVPTLILSSPYNSGLYTALYSRLGDMNGDLNKIASYFGMSSELSDIKNKILDDLFLKIKHKFSRSKADCSIARKEFIEQCLNYGRSRQETEKVLNDFIAQVKETVKNAPDEGTSTMFVVGGLIAGAMCFAVSGFMFLLCVIAAAGLFIAAGESNNRYQEAIAAKRILDNWEDDYHSSSVQNVLPTLEDSSPSIPQLPQSEQSSDDVIDVQTIEVEPKTSIVSNSERLSDNLLRRLIALIKIELIEKRQLSHELPTQVRTTKNYEPVNGITTDALIKRAFIFLEDGQFDDAGCYFNQALNQDPEDYRIHLGQLILACQFHSVEELIDKFPTPLDEDKMFQRALRFANDDAKSKLEDYANSNRAKIEEKNSGYEAELQELHAELCKLRSEADVIIEQDRIEAEARAERKRLAEEAERERQLAEQECLPAEQEADKERRYQEILAFKEKASTIQDFSEILKLISPLRSYKDNERIYEEVSEALKVETKYQNAQRELQNAPGIVNLQNVIKTFEELDDYKDSEKLLDEAQAKLEALEEYAKKMRKRTLTVLALAVIAAGSYLGWKWHKDTTARQNAMVAFFEERYDEAVDAINAVPSSADNPVLLNMLAYIDYDKSGVNHEQFRNNAESLIKNYAVAPSKKSYSDALTLSEKYLSQIPANKFQGDAYLNGWGTDKDVNKSTERFKVAAESGDVYSQEMLVKIYDTVLNDQQSAMH